MAANRACCTWSCCSSRGCWRWNWYAKQCWMPRRLDEALQYFVCSMLTELCFRRRTVIFAHWRTKILKISCRCNKGIKNRGSSYDNRWTACSGDGSDEEISPGMSSHSGGCRWPKRGAEDRGRNLICLNVFMKVSYNDLFWSLKMRHWSRRR